MRVNLTGLLRQSARAISPKRDQGAYAFMLGELADHVDGVRSGQNTLDEFADLYGIRPDAPTADAPASADDAHEFFSVSTTAYQRALDRETRNGECFAIHYQDAPKQVEGGTSFSLNFPILLVTAYAKEPQAFAERVARILEKHWNDEDGPHGR